MKKNNFPLVIWGGVTFLPFSIVSCSKTKEIVENSENQIIHFLNDNKILVKIKNVENVDEIIEIKDQKNNNLKLNKNNSFKQGDDLYLTIDDIEKLDLNSNLFIKLNNNKKLIIKVSQVKTFKQYNLEESQNYTFNLIKEISQNNIPTIIDAIDSPLVLQQGFFCALVEYFNNLNKANNDFNFVLIENKTFNRNWMDFDVLKNNGIWNGIDSLDQINKNNIRKFNLVKDNQFVGTFENYKNVIDKISNFSNNENQKFDFLLAGHLINEYIEEFKNNKQNSKLAYMLKKANRIVFLTEGGSHLDRIVPYLESMFTNFKPLEREEVIKKLNDYQNGQIEFLELEDLLNIFLLKNYSSTNQKSDFSFVSFLNYDSNIQNSLNLNDNQQWTEKTISFNFSKYANLIDDQANRQLYLQTYKNLFFKTNQEVIVNGLEQWDPNKKNAIFLGSSLFIPFDGELSITPNDFSRLQHFDNLKQKIQEVVKNLLKKFPIDQYNIIFKLHPRFASSNDPKTNNEIAQNYIKLITNNEIQNPIVINSEIPIETLLSIDYFNHINNEKSYFFNQTSKFKSYEQTTFFGLQATTSSLHSTKIFYQSTFNLTKEQVELLIPFKNFPIPKYFKMINREEQDIDENTNYYDENLNILKKMYQYVSPSIKYNNSNFKKYDSLITEFE